VSAVLLLLLQLLAADMFCCGSKDDLVVGAPFYFEHGVGGAIYVYLSGPQVCKTPSSYSHQK